MTFFKTFLFALAVSMVLAAGGSLAQDSGDTAGAPSQAAPAAPDQTTTEQATEDRATEDRATAARAQATDLFNRTATALEGRVVSDKTLEQLRDQLVVVRDRNAAIVNRGNIRASALQAQLTSLGPPPPEEQEEAVEIAARRSELTNALAEANTPVRQANETLSQAEFFIRRVDRQLRSRKFETLLSRFPSPLAPSTWSVGIQEISGFVKRFDRDLNAELARPSISKELNETLPLAIGLVIFGILFLTVLQNPVSRALKRYCDRPATGLKALLLGLLYNASFIVLPAIGVVILVSAIPILNIYPNSARTAIIAVPFMALFMIIANWIGHTLFAPAQSRWRLLDLEDHEARRGLRLCQGLGVFMAIEIAVEALQRDNNFSEGTISVLSAPPIFLAAVLLWLLARVIRSREEETEQAVAPASEDDEEVEEAYVKPEESGFLLFLSLLMRTSAILAVCVTLVGYVQMARVAIIPVIMTVAQLGIGFMLYHLVLAIVRTATRREDEAPPVFLSLGLICVLTLVFAPLIALTWGARGTDIIEVWRLFTEGVQLGDIRLSLDSFIVLVAVFGVGVVVTRWLQNLLKATVLPQTRMDKGARNAVVTGTGYVGLTLASLIAVSTAGLNLSSLAVVAGALSVGIGFGLQTIVSNFVSGIILLIERPIKEGDWIEVSGQSGYVRKISVRSTRIETFDRHDVIIPNSDLIAGIVRNMTLSNTSGRLMLPIRVAYGSDLDKVKAILLDAARGHYTIARYPAPFVVFTGLGDSSLNFELRCYLKDVNNIVTTQSDLMFTVYNELGKAGVAIPFPQRDLHIKDVDKLLAALDGRPGTGQTPVT